MIKTPAAAATQVPVVPEAGSLIDLSAIKC
jgi:hypothetical protein